MRTRSRSAGNIFDIIVTADSNNVLNENARAIQHDFSKDERGIILDGIILYSYKYKSKEWYKECERISQISEKEEIDASINEYIQELSDYGFKSDNIKNTYWIIGGDCFIYDKPLKEFSDINEFLNYEGFIGEGYTTFSNVLSPEDIPFIKFTDSLSNSFDNSNLAAWELKYCIDNDTTRFAWADNYRGKGVIFFMRDEWNNKCPYDFKNILFPRCYDEDKNCHILGNNGTDVHYCHTFAMWDFRDNTSHDVTTEQRKYLNDENRYEKNRNNIIKSYINIYYGAYPKTVEVQCLNNNCFVSDTRYCFIEEDHGEFFGCYNNVIDINSQENIFGNNTRNNKLGINCADNIFLNNYCNNTLADYCQTNLFESESSYNTLYNDCTNNQFKYYSTYNILFDFCSGNIIGIESESNVFETNANNNIIGDYSQYIKFNTGAMGNKLGSSSITNFCSNITFSSGVEHVNLHPSFTTSGNKQMKNIIINSGISYKDITIDKCDSLTTIGSVTDTKINV